jgi:hypothetical protein
MSTPIRNAEEQDLAYAPACEKETHKPTLGSRLSYENATQRFSCMHKMPEEED